MEDANSRSIESHLGLNFSTRPLHVRHLFPCTPYKGTRDSSPRDTSYNFAQRYQKTRQDKKASKKD